jgi:hypothetical protein
MKSVGVGSHGGKIKGNNTLSKSDTRWTNPNVTETMQSNRCTYHNTLPLIGNRAHRPSVPGRGKRNETGTGAGVANPCLKQLTQGILLNIDRRFLAAVTALDTFAVAAAVIGVRFAVLPAALLGDGFAVLPAAVLGDAIGLIDA